MCEWCKDNKQGNRGNIQIKRRNSMDEKRIAEIRETITRQKLRGNRYRLIKIDVKGWEDEQ